MWPFTIITQTLCPIEIEIELISTFSHRNPSFLYCP